MLYPTIEELTKGQYNRYELALATAKCARLITNEYVRQHDLAEKSLTGNKDTDKPLNTMIDRELRDEKAVHVAVSRLAEGRFEIDPLAGTREAEEAAAAEEVAEEAVAEEAEEVEEIAEEPVGSEE